MTNILLTGPRGSLVERVATLVAARSGWTIAPTYPAGQQAESGAQAILFLGWQPLWSACARPRAPEVRPWRVLVTASWETRVRRIAAEQGLEPDAAAGVAAAEQRDLDRQARMRLGVESAESSSLFDLVITTDGISPEKAASLVTALAAPSAGRRSRRRGRRARSGESQAAQDGRAGETAAPGAELATPEAPDRAQRRDGAPATNEEEPAQHTISVAGARVILDSRGSPKPFQHPLPAGVRPVFAHPSEEEFAHVLDFYRVAWQYEPTTFPLEWDEHGHVQLAFTPDFYLPDYGLYVELTTMKQSLVNRKNRKIRRLRELYPDVSIKVFYGRDFEKLLRKFGLEPPPAAPVPAPPPAVAPPPLLEPAPAPEIAPGPALPGPSADGAQVAPAPPRDGKMQEPPPAPPRAEQPVASEVAAATEAGTPRRASRPRGRRGGRRRVSPARRRASSTRAGAASPTEGAPAAGAPVEGKEAP